MNKCPFFFHIVFLQHGLLCSSADFLLEEIQTSPLPRTGAPIAAPRVSQVIPQTGLTQTETALLSPEEQIIRQRTRT